MSEEELAKWHDERAAECQEGVDAYAQLSPKWLRAKEAHDFHQSAAALIRSLSARLKTAEEALEDAESLLALKEHPARVDPDYGVEVEALGRRIGFGALMTSAQASWRAVLQERGNPLGGEFVAGPSYASVLNTLERVRRARLTLQTGRT